MRLDRFLVCARIVKTRAQASRLIADGHPRLDGRPVTRDAQPVSAGQVLTFAVNGQVRSLRILSLPGRRGPPAEAAACRAELVPPANVSQQAAAD
jgi:ribosome-associated heat shock protein Hsp15